MTAAEAAEVVAGIVRLTERDSHHYLHPVSDNMRMTELDRRCRRELPEVAALLERIAERPAVWRVE